MGIKIKWKAIGPRSEWWDYSHVLYAYLDPATDQIVYIGLAYHRTVRQRFNDRDKDALFKFLNKRGIREVEVLAGDLRFEGRLTKQLLSDIESLLIKRLRP
jgi:hypothetical protein